jgi:hypothetical protein
VTGGGNTDSSGGSGARSHKWLRADGTIAFVHAKRGDGRWFYRHQLTEAERRAARCGEHGPCTGRWCNKKPREADGLMWRMGDLVRALRKGKDVLWFAGEKDAEAGAAYLAAAGIDGRAVACTSVHQGEANTITPAQARLFARSGRKISYYPDRDSTGLWFAVRLAREIPAARLRALPGELIAEGSENASITDVSDFLASGGRLSDCRTVKVPEILAALGAEGPDEDAPARPGTARRGEGGILGSGGPQPRPLEGFRDAYARDKRTNALRGKRTPVPAPSHAGCRRVSPGGRPGGLGSPARARGMSKEPSTRANRRCSRSLSWTSLW